MQGDEGAADVTDGEELDEDPSESGYVTAYYETDGDVESDYFSGDGLADLEYCNDGYSAELTGKVSPTRVQAEVFVQVCDDPYVMKEPYELLREKRKVGRYMEEQYRSVRDMDELGDQESEIAQAEADAIARGQEKYKDRRSAKRKAGHGCYCTFFRSDTLSMLIIIVVKDLGGTTNACNRTLQTYHRGTVSSHSHIVR